ncbi:hypothetical protein QQ020_00905 [Fulvivirgaceae bacterium BMA12]|uniref:Uncharacterized protein n=1 Tax=Agaribacillus aureus TaxID=3051825 RepID=A0ABT8KYK1_9BACT|nr:hypothetical protein [Fulvivirgaceae bacterium BMA12]
MKKTTKLLMLGMFISLWFTNVNASNGFDPKENSKLVVDTNQPVIKLFYQGEKQGKVVIRIYDEKNQLIYMDRVQNENGFMRPYNFTQLSEGKYRFEITDAEGKVSKIADYSRKKRVNNKPLKVRLEPVEESQHKFKLDVVGITDEAIFIKILDKNDRELFGETIDLQTSFSRVYNLKRLMNPEVSFEVSTEEKLLLRK